MRNTFCSREAELAEADPICDTQSCSEISPWVLWLLTWRPAGGSAGLPVLPVFSLSRPSRTLAKRFDPEPEPLIAADRPAFQWPPSRISAVQLDCVWELLERVTTGPVYSWHGAGQTYHIQPWHTCFGSRGCINMGTSWYFWHISKSCRDAVRIDLLRSFKRHDLFMKWQTYLSKLFFFFFFFSPSSLLSKSFVTTAGYKGLESYTIRIHLQSPHLIICYFFGERVEQSVYLLRQRKNHNRQKGNDLFSVTEKSLNEFLERREYLFREFRTKWMILKKSVPMTLHHIRLIHSSIITHIKPPMCGIYIWCNSTLFSWLGLLFKI